MRLEARCTPVQLGCMVQVATALLEQGVMAQKASCGSATRSTKACSKRLLSGNCIATECVQVAERLEVEESPGAFSSRHTCCWSLAADCATQPPHEVCFCVTCTSLAHGQKTTRVAAMRISWLQLLQACQQHFSNIALAPPKGLLCACM
eukprot:351491-Chlamydomonas_euryale.AAC.15